jgi:4-amino-4-deoxy-L-arabinose transferase-like glycosyltransferase
MLSSTKTSSLNYLWICFLLFLISNFSLTYFDLPVQSKIIVIFSGLFIPFLIALTSAHHLPDAPTKNSEEWISPLPLSVVFLILVLAIVIRFCQLTSLSTWPISDEAIWGFFGMYLSQKWKWDFFYAFTQLPPFSFWSLGLFFKCFGVSLMSLWAFPAVLSALTLPLAYWSVKSFFSKSVSIVFSCFWAFSFWPIYLDRLCTGHGLLILWQLLTFVILGCFLSRLTIRPSIGLALLLGICTSMGFYILFHAAIMAVYVIIIVIYAVLRYRPSDRKLLYAFLFSFFLGCLPIITAWLRLNHQGDYLHYLWAFKNNVSPLSQVKVIAQYISGLFWGGDTYNYSYRAFGGGFFDPWLGSLFLIGLIQSLKNWKKEINFCLIFGLVLFLMPAFLTGEVEMFRMVLVLPFILIFCALGLQNLLKSASPQMSLVSFLTILIIVAFSDFYQLEITYRNFWKANPGISLRYTKSLQRWKAYEILDQQNKKFGPGIILTEFDPTPYDQTLTIAAYPFNAARNPQLDYSKTTWAGVITNVNYVPYLYHQIPSSQWFPLSVGLDTSQDNLVLGIIPVTPSTSKTIYAWLEMEKNLWPVTYALFQMPYGQLNPDISKMLSQCRSVINNDPFLESLLDERQFIYDMSNNDPIRALKDMQQALTSGYPAAHLYNNLGVLWFTLGNYANARESFKAALRAPLNHTQAAFNLNHTPQL